MHTQLYESLVEYQVESELYEGALIFPGYLMLTAASEDTEPPQLARQLALLYGVQFDILNNTLEEPRYKPAFSSVIPRSDVIPRVAVLAAGAEMSYEFYPGLQQLWERTLEIYTAEYESSASYHRSIAYGREMAQEVIRLRESDKNFMGQVAPAEANRAGFWKPTSPYYLQPMLANWSKMTPLYLDTADQFRLEPPLSPESEAFSQEREQVRDLGGRGSGERTEEQSQIALFWADGKGTYTPIGSWSRIAEQILKKTDPEIGSLEAVRRMATLHMALMDASIAVWDTKYTYDYWRPVDALRAVGDSEWQSFIEAPNFPEYASGHSTFSAVSARVISSWGEDTAFTADTLGLPGVERSYEDVYEAAEEAAWSRIYGGIHYFSGAMDGLEQGYDIADYVLERALLPREKAVEEGS